MFTVQYGEPSDFEDLAEVKPGVKGEGGACAVVAEPRGGDNDNVQGGGSMTVWHRQHCRLFI